jgi:DNA-directed RNA polymerase specialized sigma24 family protein
MNVLLGAAICVSTPEGTRTVSISARPADAAAEWGFVLQHSDAIDRFAAKLARADDRLDAGDLRGEAIEWIVRLHGSFDPARAAASSWIYFMVRRARQAMLVRLNRLREHETSVDPQAMYGEKGYAPEPGDHGEAVERVENALSITRAFERANAAERAAFRAVLDEDRGAARNRTLRRVRTAPPRQTRLSLAC